MTELSHPPVPKKLREMLHDYPGHIDRLQEQLNHVAEESRSASSKFEVATWMLEGQLEEFVREAKTELEAVEATNDADGIAGAREKERLMSHACWKHIWVGDEELWRYFEQAPVTYPATDELIATSKLLR